jgi:hypothetical protein
VCNVEVGVAEFFPGKSLRRHAPLDAAATHCATALR